LVSSCAARWLFDSAGSKPQVEDEDENEDEDDLKIWKCSPRQGRGPRRQDHGVLSYGHPGLCSSTRAKSRLPAAPGGQCSYPYLALLSLT